MITEALIQEVTESLYSAALRRVPPDTLRALDATRESEAQESARATLDLMVRSARLAEAKDRFVCSDSGVPTYLVEIGGSAQWQGDIKAAITRGFDHLVERILEGFPASFPPQQDAGRKSRPAHRGHRCARQFHLSEP